MSKLTDKEEKELSWLASEQQDWNRRLNTKEWDRFTFLCNKKFRNHQGFRPRNMMGIMSRASVQLRDQGTGATLKKQ